MVYLPTFMVDFYGFHVGKYTTYSAKGPLNKSLNFIFPTKYGIPKSLKVGHWLSQTIHGSYGNCPFQLFDFDRNFLRSSDLDNCHHDPLRTSAHRDGRPPGGNEEGTE